MKRIGIITFHRAHNYGSVLQAYALQKKVSNIISCSCETIDFIPPNQKEMYSVFKKNDSIKNICKNIVSLSKYKLLTKRYQEFNKFINTQLKLSSKNYNSKDELEKSIDNYDTLICGSDQIWNTSIPDFDDSYFLTFMNNVKKISYAPSMGGGNSLKSTELKKRIIEYLKDFSALSARESKGKNILKELTDKKIEKVLDPTLLLEFKEWDKLCSNRSLNKDYIFFYSIDYNNDAIKIVKQISKKLKLPVIILFTTNKTYKTMFSGFEISKYESPADFINLIKNAKLILSSSFHGNVFATIYRKPFYVLRGTYDGKINNDDRLTTLLEEFKLTDRQVNINTVDSLKDPCTIDYTESEKYINEARQKSIDYLLNSINGE